jgi:hypothetical protein
MERTFNESRCAYCGQELPIEMLEDAKTKFNKQKQDDLELCVSRGKLTRSTMDGYDACIKRLEDEIKDIENNRLPKFNEQLTSLETDKQILVNTYIKFENTKEYAELRNEIDELTASLPIVPDSNAAMWVEEKKRKDKLWKVEATIKNENLYPEDDDCIIELRKSDIPFNYIDINKYIIINCYCATQKDSAIVKEILDKYNAKYFASESKIL